VAEYTYVFGHEFAPHHVHPLQDLSILRAASHMYVRPRYAEAPVRCVHLLLSIARPTPCLAAPSLSESARRAWRDVARRERVVVDDVLYYSRCAHVLQQARWDLWGELRNNQYLISVVEVQRLRLSCVGSVALGGVSI